MGKGDKKSKRGKIIIGTYGVSRKRKSGRIMKAAPVKKDVITAEVQAEPKASSEKKTTTTSAKATAKSAPRTAVKKTETEKKTVAKKPAAKEKKTGTDKEEK